MIMAEAKLHLLRVCLVSVPRNKNKNKIKFDGIQTVLAVAKLSSTVTQCLSANLCELYCFVCTSLCLLTKNISLLHFIHKIYFAAVIQTLSFLCDISGSMCQKYFLDFMAFYEQIYIENIYGP